LFTPFRSAILQAIGSLICLFAIAPVPTEAQWTKCVLPAGYGENVMYLDVFFLPADPRYGWVCSEDGRVIRTTDGGTTWLGTRINGDPFLESIQFLTPLVGYTSGPGGIFRSNNGGISWFNVSPSVPPGDNPWGCYFLTQNEGVYLVGGCQEPPRFYRTIDGGTTWSFFEGNDIGTGLTDAILYRDGTGYAASSGIIWSTNDYGRTWNEFATSGFRTWNEELSHVGRSFLVPSAGSECFGGGLVTGEYRFSTDMGASWTRFRTPSTNYGTFLVSERAGWGVGSERQVYYTSDAGRTWELRACGIDATSNLDDIWMISDTLGFVVGTEVYRSNFNARPRLVTIAQGDLVYVCQGDSVLLTSTPDLLRYKWSDGLTGPDRYASKPGRYIVTAFDTLTCTASADTITLRVFPTTAPLILNGLSGATYCYGDSAMLRVTNGPYRSFRWSTGDTTDAIVVRASATVTVTATDTNGCALRSKPFIADIRPLFEPTITAAGKTTICLDDSVTLVAPRGMTSYRWNTGETTPSISVSSAGTYYCDIIDEYGCPGTSNRIDVVVLNLRNQIDVQNANIGPGLQIPDVTVGNLTCRDLVIRNRDSVRPLVISRPFMVVNLRCSMPQGQFPIVIAPLDTKTLRICCSSIDSGLVVDTIIIPDTCRDVPVPVFTTGLVETLTGTSRCDLPVLTTIIRAGSTYQMMAPYPNPSSSTIETEVVRIGPGDVPTLIVEDAVRREVMRATSVEAREEGGMVRYVFRVDVSMLPTGPYVLLLDANGPAGAVAVTVLH
jgi:photosystem II stability/assembly factor-like uncharacterized protein